MSDEVYFLIPSMPFNAQLEWASGSGFETLSVCPDNPQHKHTRPRRPLKIVAPLAHTTDFLWTVYNDCMVTNAIKDVLTANHVSGIEFHPVVTFSTSGFETNLELFELVAVGWGGLVGEGSTLQVLERCPWCARTVFSMVHNGRIEFDIDEWDGSDFFIVWPLPGYKVISSNFKYIVKHHGWTGVRFMEFENWKPGLAGTLTPGLVSSWVEGIRGKELQASVDSKVIKRYLGMDSG